MSWRKKLLSPFDVRPGEGRLVLFLLAMYFCIGIARIFTRTSAYTLFLVEFDAQSLPYIYIGISVVVSLISVFYLKLGERLSFLRLLAANLGFILLALVVYRLGLALTGSRWLSFALPIWYEILWTLTSLAFWALAGRVFNVRQGRRLFGLVGAGEWIAVAIGGFLMPAVVALMGARNLLLMAAVGAVGALVLLFYIARQAGGHLDAPAESDTAPEAAGSTGLLRERYILLIFGLFLLWVVSYFFVDNIFYDRVVDQFPAEDELAGFIGVFFAVTGVVTLLASLLATAPIISRFGLQAGLLSLPVTLLVGAIALGVGGTALGVTAALLWIAAPTKLLNIAIGFSVDRSGLAILYQPLPAGQRVRAQTVTEGVVYPLGIGLAGGLLLLLTGVLGLNVVHLAFVLILILALWITISVLLIRGYPEMLMKALAKRRLGSPALSFSDGSSVTVLQEALQSPHPGAVVYALDMLAEASPESLAASLPDLLDHPVAEVRHEALRRIERLDLTPALDRVRRRMEVEDAPPVRAAALRTFAALADPAVLEQLFPYLDDPDPQVRLGAIVGLLRNGGLEAAMVAGGRLTQLAVSTEGAERVLAAEVIGEVRSPNLQQLLAQLLADEDLRVRRAALVAAGAAGYPRLWPLVLEQTAAPGVGATAAAALIAGGEAVLPDLEAVLAGEGRDSAGLARLVQVCGRIGGERAIALLKARIDHPDEAVRTQVLRSLCRCDYRAQGDDVARVEAQVRAEAADAAWAAGAMVDLGEAEAVSLLQGALAARMARSRDRIFNLLSFLYDARSILRARDTLAVARVSAEKRAYALEVLDVLIGQELKAQVFPLLQGLTPEQCLQSLSPFFPQARSGRPERLREILAAPAGQVDDWIKACSLAAVGALPEPALAGAALLALSAPAPLLRETAVWTLGELGEAAHRPQIDALRDDPNPRVARAVEHVLAAGNSRPRSPQDRLSSTTKKVSILKTAGIFAGTPDEVLVEVAALFEPVELKAGQTIIEKGELGRTMFVIVEGQVRVHDDGQTVNRLQARDVFGELALLDPQPRAASVTAVVDTSLLRLDQEPFYDLMADRIDVTRGIVRVLSGKLRTALRDLNETHARFEALSGRR